jgi:hypothetical protein
MRFSNVVKIIPTSDKQDNGGTARPFDGCIRITSADLD